jgi:outer membrane biosynthesis protein TonB
MTVDRSDLEILSAAERATDKGIEGIEARLGRIEQGMHRLALADVRAASTTYRQARRPKPALSEPEPKPEPEEAADDGEDQNKEKPKPVVVEDVEKEVDTPAEPPRKRHRFL